MFDTPYQTTAASRYDLSKTIVAVRKLEINEELIPAVGSLSGVKFVPPGEETILPFQQPLTTVEIPTLESTVVIDGRSLLRSNGKPVRDDAYNHAVMIGDLTVLWLQNKDLWRKDLLDIGEFPAKVFVRWMSQALTTRLTLDAVQVALVRSLLFIYYIQLFNPLSEHATDEDRDRLLTRAARYIVGVDSETLSGIVGKVPVLNNLADLVKWIKERLDSPRTEKLTVGLIFDAIGFSYGQTYKESVCVALEYPPVFVALVYKTCLERSYTRSGLGRVIETVVSRGNDKDYVKSLENLLRAR
jgi:hypothetical protein